MLRFNTLTSWASTRLIGAEVCLSLLLYSDLVLVLDASWAAV